MLWCLYPFKHQLLVANKKPIPCCRFDNHDLSDDDITLDENGYYFKTIREKIQNNEIPAGCHKCVTQEKFNPNSMRKESFDLFTNDRETKIEGMEIIVGRHCNLKCFSCDQTYSTLWDEDIEIISSSLDPKINQLKEKFYIEKDELDIDQIPIERFKDVKFLKITGGEPFLHKQFHNLYRRLAEAGLSKQIELEIFTNCTWFPKKVDYDALSTFNSLIISASIDGYKEVQEILRPPSKWTVIESVLNKWIKFSKDNKNVQCKIAYTIGLQNVLYMPEFIDWADSLKLRIMPQLIFDPPYMSIVSAPPELKKRLLNKLQEKATAIDTNNKKRLYKLVFGSLENQDYETADYEDFTKLAKIKNVDYSPLNDYTEIINDFIK